VQTCGGPLFFMQAQKGGSNNLVHVIEGGVIMFYAKLLGSRSQSRILLKSQSFLCKYDIEHILYLMTVEY